MENNSPKNNNKIVKKLVLTVALMFGFGFALVPLYDVFCDITGLNGKTSTTAAVTSDFVDTSRTITVEFIARTQGSLPWDFRPEVKRIEVHPGEMHELNFIVKNKSVNDMVVQAVPSVSPGIAAAYFNKIECFCFNRQPLEKGETADLGLQFYIDNALPEEYKIVTLSYTLFDISEKIEHDEFEQLFAGDTLSAP
ncbi:cytochrome c oxidase assembly protein [Psychrosphaera sp. 1_MG-2023]|uniref:cytochrome c oxidase assembly protein n=1 Tax=Psychrosphaera sp. 1_MG-2023 TaxID=3062643 RepID=UPI0026E470A2|nr:cytochrome c oxidase assembly protein [Psychrosphaera sp. 1_MG-2023]MDO6719004.1 cytochrome c oxidase assembly protein [Psychrosphaera sp. 1_MG-2023]